MVQINAEAESPYCRRPERQQPALPFVWRQRGALILHHRLVPEHLHRLPTAKHPVPEPTQRHADQRQHESDRLDHEVKADNRECIREQHGVDIGPLPPRHNAPTETR